MFGVVGVIEVQSWGIVRSPIEDDLLPATVEQFVGE